MWSETTSPNCWGSQLSNQNEFRSVLLKLRFLESRRASSCEGQLSAFFYYYQLRPGSSRAQANSNFTLSSFIYIFYIILKFLKILIVI